MSRPYTNLLRDAIAEEMFDQDQVLESFFRWFSEDEIKQFCLKAESRGVAWQLSRLANSNDFEGTPELESEYDYIIEAEGE